MRRPIRPRQAIDPAVAPLRNAVVSAALVAGVFGLLVAVAHPIPAAAALGSVAVVGAAGSRLRRRLGLRRFAGETAGDTGEDATDPSAV